LASSVTTKFPRKHIQCKAYMIYVYTYIINKWTGLNVTAFVLMGSSIICSVCVISIIAELIFKTLGTGTSKLKLVSVKCKLYFAWNLPRYTFCQHPLHPSFCKIRIRSIFPSVHRSPRWLLSIRRKLCLPPVMVLHASLVWCSEVFR